MREAENWEKGDFLMFPVFENFGFLGKSLKRTNGSPRISGMRLRSAMQGFDFGGFGHLLRSKQVLDTSVSKLGK